MRDVYPPRREQPRLWRWADIRALLLEAARRTDIESAERRVLTLVNQDAFGAHDCVATTTNLSANFQVLMPGETAPAHCHSMGALRFVVEGNGAMTIVNGQECPMGDRDLVLTPAWCLHEHMHRGNEPAIWLDLLDAPLIKHLDLVRFERKRQKSDSGRNAGFGHSSPFHYSWDAARTALASLQTRPDGARVLRYADPMTGGPVMNLIDCYLWELAPRRPTRAQRSTSNAVAFVCEGRGASRIGGTRIAWSRNDLFTLPHGHWISHEGDDGGAILFLGTDRDVLRRLGLLADEFAEAS